MLLAFALLAAAPVDHPRTYLLSLTNLPVKADERIESFKVETWGVTFKAVCRVPYGWTITAGNSAAPDGALSGVGSHGVTWFTGSNPKQLRGFVLVTLYGPIQPRDVRSGTGVVPATFKGWVGVYGDNDENVRKMKINTTHIKLRPANHCPPLR